MIYHYQLSRARKDGLKTTCSIPALTPGKPVVAATNRSAWLRTEFSCSGFPADQTVESEGTERRWGSYTCGRMYIAYACSQRYMRRVIRVAIAQAHPKLEISLHLHCWGGESAAGPEPAQFAVATFYDPGDPSQTEVALGIFKTIAEFASVRKASNGRTLFRSIAFSRTHKASATTAHSNLARSRRQVSIAPCVAPLSADAIIARRKSRREARRGRPCGNAKRG
jgi:hypothetical protein